jgi:hypothetical protein
MGGQFAGSRIVAYSRFVHSTFSRAHCGEVAVSSQPLNWRTVISFEPVSWIKTSLKSTSLSIHSTGKLSVRLTLTKSSQRLVAESRLDTLEPDSVCRDLTTACADQCNDTSWPCCVEHRPAAFRCHTTTVGRLCEGASILADDTHQNCKGCQNEGSPPGDISL